MYYNNPNHHMFMRLERLRGRRKERETTSDYLPLMLAKTCLKNQCT